MSDTARSDADTADERMCNPLSRAELQRRWAAIRGHMRSAGLDALIVQATNATSTGGYYRWFTGLAGGVGNPNTLIFPLEGLSTLVCHGDEGGARELTGDEAEFPGIGRRISVPNFPNAPYLSALDSERVAEVIVREGFRSIGMVGPNNMSFSFGSKLRERLGKLKIVDVTDAVDHLKAIKSTEEIAFIRRVAAMQDDIIAKLAQFIRPGLRDFEVGAYAQYVGQKLGSEAGHFHIASAPADAPTVFKQRQHQGRTIRAGDVLLFQCENNGPAGYLVHIARAFVLGTIPDAMSRSFDAAVAAQDYTAELLHKGGTGAEIFAAYNAYLDERKLPRERRLHCHGQGYDTVERPLARPEEPMAIRPGMNIGIHPGFSQGGKFITVCDNYLIGSDNVPERLHHTPRQIYEL